MANEKHLIDAKPLMQNGWHLVKTGESNRFICSMSLADVPTVDAVEVVRCKDCVYNENGTCTHSECFDDTKYRPDYFCADGERREGE